MEVLILKGIIGDEKDLTASSEGPFPAKILVSLKDLANVSVKVGRLEVGKEIGLHTHDEVDQFEYYLGGKAKLFVEGVGQRDKPWILHVRAERCQA
jgi:quercetin dioxygenase-like cupin family protein